MAAAFRCSLASRTRGEPMAGTASTVRDWLLLEHPGPWGRDALLDGRALAGIGGQLRDRARRAGVRVLLIRRPGETRPPSTTAFAIHSGPDVPWVERIALARIEDAVLLDLERLGDGRRLGRGEPHAEALFLVCTHGRHDACCAERGRPLATAMASAFPSQTWEVSHIGGDRFAANLLAFPLGIYFGRVPPEEGASVGASYLEGRLDVERLRGRSCFAMPVQAAEVALRRHTGLDRIDDVELEHAVRVRDGALARYRTAVGGFTVRVKVSSTEPVLLTCRSEHEEPAPDYEATIEPVAGSP